MLTAAPLLLVLLSCSLIFAQSCDDPNSFSQCYVVSGASACNGASINCASGCCTFNGATICTCKSGYEVVGSSCTFNGLYVVSSNQVCTLTPVPTFAPQPSPSPSPPVTTPPPPPPPPPPACFTYTTYDTCWQNQNCRWCDPYCEDATSSCSTSSSSGGKLSRTAIIGIVTASVAVVLAAIVIGIVLFIRYRCARNRGDNYVLQGR